MSSSKMHRRFEIDHKKINNISQYKLKIALILKLLIWHNDQQQGHKLQRIEAGMDTQTGNRGMYFHGVKESG
ncbi:MAG: hypothetical protein ACO2ZM_04315 [Francisellaceae bacterium]